MASAWGGEFAAMQCIGYLAVTVSTGLERIERLLP